MGIFELESYMKRYVTNGVTDVLVKEAIEDFRK